MRQASPYLPEKDAFSRASHLFLVGTVHGDDWGNRKCLSFLDRFRPDLIFVELSPFGYVFRKRHQRSLSQMLLRNLKEAANASRTPFGEALSNPRIRSIRRQITLPFEYRAAKAYALKTTARLLLVDDSRFSRQWIASWPELLSTQNLTILLSLQGPILSTQASYQLARREVFEGRSAMMHELRQSGDGEALKMWQRRENFMAGKIQTAMAAHKPRRPVYLGGWQHLVNGGKLLSLRDLLQIEPSQCRLLSSKAVAAS